MALVVRHRRVQQNFVHFFFEDENALVFLELLVAGEVACEQHWWRQM